MKPFYTFALLLFSVFGYSQKATYKISMHGINVGSQTVTQTVNNSITTIEVRSKAKVSLGFSYTISYHQWAKYNENYLLESKVTITKNDKEYSTSHTKWAGDHYEVIQDGKKSQIPGELHFATTRLYFNKPQIQQSRIYSEADCTIKVLEQKEPNNFLVYEPNVSRGGHYIYKNGTLHKAIIDHSFVDFVIELSSYTP